MTSAARPRTRRVRWIVIAAVIVFALAAIAAAILRPWEVPRSASSSPVVLVSQYRSAEDGQVSFGGGLGQAGLVEFGFNARRCLTFGNRLVIAQPGSHLSADGRSVTIVFVDGGTHTFGIGQPVRLGLGGTPAYTEYEQTTPALANGVSAADCGATPKTVLLVLQGADPPPAR